MVLQHPSACLLSPCLGPGLLSAPCIPAETGLSPPGNGVLPAFATSREPQHGPQGRRLPLQSQTVPALGPLSSLNGF